MTWYVSSNKIACSFVGFLESVGYPITTRYLMLKPRRFYTAPISDWLPLKQIFTLQRNALPKKAKKFMKTLKWQQQSCHTIPWSPHDYYQPDWHHWENLSIYSWRLYKNETTHFLKPLKILYARSTKIPMSFISLLRMMMQPMNKYKR